MYKSIFIASACCLAASSAHAANVQFFGRFHWTSANATCLAIGYPESPSFMRFAPPNLGGNGTQTRLTVMGERQADNWTLASGTLVGSAYKKVKMTGVGFSAGSLTVKMRITSQTPAAITATTPMVIIKGNIQDYAGDLGCTMGFAAVGYLG